MKKNYAGKILFFFLLLAASTLKSQNVAINTSGNTAYASAILDLSNNNTVGTVGFLPPYVTLTSLSTFSPVTGTAAQSSGLLVYNTGGTYAAGLYYWNNTTSTWNPMGSTLSGAGTLNYLARWTPSGSVLGIGVTQDNGLRVGIQTTVYAFTAGNMLQVTGNATDVSAILGTTPEATGYGVQGSNTAGSGSTAGVYGNSTSAAGFGVLGVDNVANGTGVKGSNTQITGTSTGVTGSVGTYNAPAWGAVGVYGSANNNTTYGVEGNNPSGDPTGGAGVIGYDYSGTGVIGSNDLITQVGFYKGPHGTGGNFFSAYQGLVGSYNMTGAGGTGVVGFGYNSGGPINPNSGYGYDFGVLGDFGGTAGGAGSGAAVGGFIGATAVPGYRAGVMGGSNATDYGVLGYNTLATGYPLAAINSTGITGNGLFVSGVTYLDGFTGVENPAPTTLFQVGNAATTSGKASIFSQDHVFGQFQIGNPTNDGEASMEFISGATAFGFPATSVNGTNHLWNVGAGCYNLGGAKFTIADDNIGVIMTLTSTGLVGIGATSPNQELELGGTANTARIDGLGSTGTTFNQASGTNKADLVYANDANGDLWSIPAPSAASVLVSSATGVLSWQTGTPPSGSGTNNYYARWTPNGTTLGIGFTEDNGTSISMSNPASAPVNNTMLTVTANATSVNAIVGTTAQNTGNGVFGIGSATGTTGVYGSASGTGTNELGVYANNTATGAGIQYGIEAIKSGATGTGTGYAVSGVATGTATTNYGGYFSASGGTNNYGVIVPAAGGNSGFGTITPTTLLQVGNAATTTGKLSVFSQDFQYGQIQIGNPNANSEASMQFISNVSTFGSAAASASGNNYSWNIGAGTYGAGGQKFIISNLGFGPIMTFVTPTGYVGIGNTNPSQNLSVQNGQNIDMANLNSGFLNNGLTTGNGLTFGAGSGEGVASKRTAGGNQFGLDFYTNFTNKMSITNGGFVGIGTTVPAQQLEIASTTSTVRINGIKSGNTYYSSITAPVAASSVMYANNTTGDVSALAPGTTGQVLTQTATGPAWGSKGISSMQVFTSSGTYTPTAGTTAIMVQMIGGGGGGGGAAISSNCGGDVGGGGGAGGYVEGIITALAANYAIVIGAPGTAGSNAGGNGGNGGNTTMNGWTASGGSGGTGDANKTAAHMTNGGIGGAAAGGTLDIAGSSGRNGLELQDNANTGYCFSGEGASTKFGAGGAAVGGVVAGSIAGNPPVANTGAGGSGAVANWACVVTSAAGGAGASGIVIIYEYK